MFWDIFISRWYLLYILAFVFRGVGGAYLSGSDIFISGNSEGGLIGFLGKITFWGGIIVPLNMFGIVPWWAALISFPMGLIISAIARLVLIPILALLASNPITAFLSSLASAILMVCSAYDAFAFVLP